jgi:hypothetical protein
VAPATASAIQPLPPGASAPVPEVVNPWSLPPLGGGVSLGPGEGLPRLARLGWTLGTPGTQGGKQAGYVSSQSDDDDALLAYLLNAGADADDGEGLGGGRGDRRSLGGHGGGPGPGVATATAQPAAAAGTARPATVGTAQPAAIAQPVATAAAPNTTPVNGSTTTQDTNTSMNEDREREQGRHVRFGGGPGHGGEVEERRR